MGLAIYSEFKEKPLSFFNYVLYLLGNSTIIFLLINHKDYNKYSIVFQQYKNPFKWAYHNNSLAKCKTINQTLCGCTSPSSK